VPRRATLLEHSADFLPGNRTTLTTEPHSTPHHRNLCDPPHRPGCAREELSLTQSGMRTPTRSSTELLEAEGRWENEGGSCADEFLRSRFSIQLARGNAAAGDMLRPE